MNAPDLANIEERLREGHANQALADVRRQLRLRTLALRFKDDNATSQGAYTRMRALLDQIEAKIRAAHTRYNTSRNAILSLRGHGPWEDILQILKREDLRGINEHAVVAEEKEADHRAQAASNGSEPNMLRTISTLHLRT
ncbi:hypothetical protein H0H92_001327, partial [Tricholoma furcatifolium]